MNMGKSLAETAGSAGGQYVAAAIVNYFYPETTIEEFVGRLIGMKLTHYLIDSLIISPKYKFYKWAKAHHTVKSIQTLFGYRIIE